MKTKIFMFLLGCFCGMTGALNAQHFISATKIETASSSYLDVLFYFAAGTSDAPHYAVDTYKILYKTTNAFNQPDTASGALMIPQGTPCDTFPLLSYEHGTVLGKFEVPSRSYNYNIEGYTFSSKGFVVTMPDYLGLGDGRGFHPYLHAQTEASASIDLMRAAREYITDSAKGHLNGQVFITGYSQGGHSAMALLKYLQDSSLLGEFHVIAGAPMSGPYSLSLAEASLIVTPPYFNSYMAYIINSYQYVYGNLFAGISAYYDAPYDATIPPYFDGTHTASQLTAALPASVYDFMQDSVLANFIPDTILFNHPLRHDLKLNDNYSWAATMPVKLCYCGADETVSPRNSLMAYDSMSAHGAVNVSIIDINSALDHSQCALVALPYVRAWFNSFRTDCSDVINGVNEMAHLANTVLVYPNPAAASINIHAAFIIKEAELVSVDGKSIYKKSVNAADCKLDVSALATGFYILKATDSRGYEHLKKVMVVR